MKTFLLRMSIRTLAIAALIAIVGMLAGAENAAAQPCCPTYTTRVSNAIPAACFPITIAVKWANAAGTSTHAMPGTTVTVPAPNPPGCWQPPITGIRVNGVNVPVPPVGGCVGFVIAPCGVFAQLCLALDVNGCVVISIQ